jgi:choline dehydrogenase-like flavoprotein
MTIYGDRCLIGSGRRIVEGGVSPAWPFSYATLEPCYGKTEELFAVRVLADSDSIEGPRSPGYSYAHVGHAEAVELLRSCLIGAGRRQFPLRLALDNRHGFLRCGTCGAFPCRVDANGNEETAVCSQP